IIKLYKMYRANASYIGKILRAKGYSIDNNRINQVLKEAGFAMSEPKKWHRKKWIRYERILKFVMARGLAHDKGSKVEGIMADRV
ncbi:MAG: hypothetical protein RXR51_08960, partial [Nitrososphaeria archaeon]